MRPITLGLLLALLWLLPSLASTGRRPVGPLETISSIPFPQTNGLTLITEALAHADIQLHEPTLGKKLVLDIQFIPNEVNTLAVGVRSSSFWFSYEPTVFYRRQGQDITSLHTASVTIPLTDKLADSDQTIDIVFFANPPVDPARLQANPASDITAWQLAGLNAQVELALPTIDELKDFIRSVVTRERVL